MTETDGTGMSPQEVASASESASLSGHKAADAETKLTRYKPDVAGLNH